MKGAYCFTVSSLLGISTNRPLSGECSGATAVNSQTRVAGITAELDYGLLLPHRSQFFHVKCADGAPDVLCRNSSGKTEPTSWR
jgi:hypothetical protein